MAARSLLHRRTSRSRRTDRRLILELLELDARVQPTRLNLAIPSLTLDVAPALFQSTSTFSSNVRVATPAAPSAAAPEQVTVTETVIPLLDELIVTVTFTPSATAKAPPKPSAPSVGEIGASTSAATPSAVTTPIASPLQAGEVTVAAAAVRGMATSPATTTPFVIVADSPTVRGGGPTNDTVAVRTSGLPTTGVLGPPTATTLQTGGNSGVEVADGSAGPMVVPAAVPGIPATATPAGATGGESPATPQR
ncbi:MAG TPA: hypothetical protein VH120_09120, partial [Gemmataceae bacterium]|nr:hypothetical protein [Gemmataceae bacterium]